MRPAVPDQRARDPRPRLLGDPLAGDRRVGPARGRAWRELTFDTETLGYIRLFEERTGARVKDCFEAEDKLIFLVQPGEIPKAVGPGGVVVDRLKEMLKKEIQVVEYSDDAEALVRNVFFAFGPTTRRARRRRGRAATPRSRVDPAWKARAIGKAGKNLKIARAILMRHTDIVSVSVA